MDVPKPPPKAGVIMLRPRSGGGKAAQTRATTAAIAARNTAEEPNAPTANLSEGDVNHSNPTNDQSSSGATSQVATYSTIVDMLAAIIQNGKLDVLTKQKLLKVIKIAKEAEVRTEEKDKSDVGREKEKVSAIRAVIQKDLAEIHNLLEKQIIKVKEDCSIILDNASKVLKEVEETKTDTKDLACKVNKVTDAADKIASDTSSYQNALLAKLVPSNKISTDPRILNDMDCKAKQILMDIYDKDSNNILTKSLTAIVDKANKTIAGIKDASKPKDIKVTVALKMRGQTVLLTLNSKEAAKWIREPGNKEMFANRFSAEAHIRERSFNLIVPRVPITFKPSEGKHLQEIEEANNLDKNMLSKARWIKPVERRRPEQTHAYAIITLTSADSANILIRDGLVICSTKVRPTKQKHEPIQCMKCRRWGHLAAECPSEKDICGNCGNKHRTNTCRNRNEPYCVACEDGSHASWSRNCPELIRRCAIYDERNPENAMPYFPTEHDWSLVVQPGSLPMADRFPAKYAVNVLPITGNRQQALKPRQPHKGQKRGPWDRNNHENPNMITIRAPLNRQREEGEPPSGAEWWQMDAGTGIANTDKNAPLEPSGWD